MTQLHEVFAQATGRSNTPSITSFINLLPPCTRPPQSRGLLISVLSISAGFWSTSDKERRGDGGGGGGGGGGEEREMGGGGGEREREREREKREREREREREKGLTVEKFVCLFFAGTKS